MTNYEVEIEYLDNKFQATVEVDDTDPQAVDILHVTLDTIYRPFADLKKTANATPWQDMKPEISFTADWLPNSVIEQIEEQVYREISLQERDWDADDYYKDQTNDR
jgi:hypothetical protein